MPIIRKRLYETEGAPPDTRVNPETGEVETTPDGGITWLPNPGADPRTNPAYLLPATTEGNCAAAAGMIAKMQEFISHVGTAVSIAGLAGILLGVALLPVSWMFILFLSIAGSAFLVGGVTIAAAFTSEVWDDLLCILFCNSDENGQVSAAQLVDIRADIAALGIANVIVGTDLIFEAWGHVGLSNAGVALADPEANCSACDCSECPNPYLGGFGFTGLGFRGQFGGFSGDPRGTYDATNDQIKAVFVIDANYLDFWMPAGTWSSFDIHVFNISSVVTLQVFSANGSPTPVYDSGANIGTGDYTITPASPQTGAPGTGAWIRLAGAGDQPPWVNHLCFYE